MATYDSLRRQCRTLENLLDSKLTSYSRLATSFSQDEDVEAGGSGDRRKDMEGELDDLLEKLNETNNELSRIINDPDSPPSQSMSRTVQRHREVLRDYERDCARAKANVKTALDRASLLSGVRNDIDAYKSNASDMLLTERERIDRSHRVVDDTLDQAYETRAEFARQRQSLAGITTRMTHVINTMPGINNLLGMIKTRRRRDALVLGLVIGLCFILLFSYMTS